MPKIKIILSTGNIVSGGPSIVREPGAYRSNLELTNSLRSHFLTAQQDYAAAADNGDSYSRLDASAPIDVWTAREGAHLYIPRLDWSTAGLQEEPGQYEITVKMFFLPTAPASEREEYIRNAMDLVMKELNVSTIDLLIASFPGMSFDGDCEWEADKKNAAQGNDEEEITTWKIFESLQKSGTVKALGISEFGSEKLSRFMRRITVRPTVNQINIRDCCNVPPPLTKLAREENIELLVHTDCTNILPADTLSELLGPGLQGAGVVASPRSGDSGQENGTRGLKGSPTPEWVARYVAVVRDRGVIENKGYFAGASLVEDY